MPQLSQVVNSNEEDISSVVRGTVITSDRRVGIEVELENITSRHTSQWWDCIGDDSLRNEGREFVFKRPVGGVDVEKAVRGLVKMLRNEDQQRSIRTSTHVHVDVRDYSVEQLGNLILLYTACESYIYTLGGKHRYDNIYCPGFTSSQQLLSQAAKMLVVRQGSLAGELNRWCKYSGFNLGAILQHGSVEFRMFEGYSTPHLLLQWVKCVTKLVDTAHEMTRAEVLECIGGDAIRSIYGDHTIHPDITNKNKQNAIFVAYSEAIVSDTVSGRTVATPTTDKDMVLAQIRALALGE